MEPFKALIVPLVAPTEPPPTGEPPHPNHDLPLFPFHPIVIPPGGVWPGEPPPTGEEQPPKPNHDLPLFPFHPIVVPPGGAWPEPPEPPTDPNAPHPEHPIELPKPSQPIELPPNDGGYWVCVYVPGVGWCWVAITPTPLPPKGEMPQPKK